MQVLKGFAKIKGVKHTIKLKEGAEPISYLERRRSPKETKTDQNSMGKLLELGLLEKSVSHWAANNLFVRKKINWVRVTMDYRALNNVTVTDFYSMEDVRQTV